MTCAGPRVCQTRGSNSRTKQQKAEKQERRDRKKESNDSPEIADRGKNIRHPGKRNQMTALRLQTGAGGGTGHQTSPDSLRDLLRQAMTKFLPKAVCAMRRESMLSKYTVTAGIGPKPGKFS